MDNRMNYCPMMQMYGMPCNAHMPMEQMPMQQMPMQQMPMHQMPNNQMPMQMPMQQMPMEQMPMQQMPMHQMPNNQMPMQMPMQQMPMQQMPNNQMPMQMPMGVENEELEAEMMDMYPENCKKMMPFVHRQIDKMEKNDPMLYDKQMDKNMVEHMTDEMLDDMRKEMPEMVEEPEAKSVANIAQFGRRRNFGRDLLQILFLEELFRRNRGRRRRDFFDYSPYPRFPYGY